MILAAFRPDTKARLAQENLVVPTVQMVFRRSLQNVRSRDDYFSAAAHPAAFEGYDLNLARMVSLANSIEPDAIPPQVRIRMVEEDLGTEGVDYFGAGLSEQLFDTPAAIARIWRSSAGRRTMLVSAEETARPERPPAQLRVAPAAGRPGAGDDRARSSDGRSARITIDWHEPFRDLRGQPAPHLARSTSASSPTTACTTAPRRSSAGTSRRTRPATYAPGPDGAPRIAAIDHADPARAEAYADPMLMARADWRDDYAYAADGTLLGWTRTRARPHRGVHRRRPSASSAAAPDGRAASPPKPSPIRRRRSPTARLAVEEVRPIWRPCPARAQASLRRRRPRCSARGTSARCARARAKARKAASGLRSRGRPLACQKRRHSASSQ